MFPLDQNYLNTLHLLQHSSRIIHWLVACQVGDIINHQSRDNSNSQLPEFPNHNVKQDSRRTGAWFFPRALQEWNFFPASLSRHLRNLWMLLVSLIRQHPTGWPSSSSLTRSPCRSTGNHLSSLWVWCAGNFTQRLADPGLDSFFGCADWSTQRSEDPHSSSLWKFRHSSWWCDLLSANQDLSSRPWVVPRLSYELIA